LNKSLWPATGISHLTRETFIKSLFLARQTWDRGASVFAFLALLFLPCFPAFAGDLRSDIVIVRAILDSNGVYAPVSSVATTRNGRIVALHFNETYREPGQGRPGFTGSVAVYRIPSSINGLDALDTLEISYFIAGANLTLPSYVGGLSRLRCLSITGAALDSLPNGFSKLVGLRTITLAGDGLVTFPDEITGLPNLVDVDLSQNRIRAIPQSIASMQRLRSLTMRSQETDSIFSIPLELARDSLLSTLDISSNNVSVFPSAIFRLKHLTELHVENCRLSELPPELGTLEELAYFNAGWNGCSRLPAGLSGLRSLKTLILVSNPLDSFPGVICDLTGLTCLDLQDCNLTTIPPAIGSLSLLQELNVCYNRISSIPPEIGSLKNVTTLRLQDNNLSSLPDEITNLTPRNWLSLMSNPVFEPTRVDAGISAWLCHYDANWANDFSVCNGRTSVVAESPDKKLQPVFTACAGMAHYELFSPSMVSLKLYDMQGRLLKVLCNRAQPCGAYDVGIPAYFATRMCALNLKVDGVEITRLLSAVK
jgi:Leucine-rich repeat (LRR) protein